MVERQLLTPAMENILHELCKYRALAGARMSRKELEAQVEALSGRLPGRHWYTRFSERHRALENQEALQREHEAQARQEEARAALTPPRIYDQILSDYTVRTDLQEISKDLGLPSHYSSVHLASNIRQHFLQNPGIKDDPRFTALFKDRGEGTSSVVVAAAPVNPNSNPVPPDGIGPPGIDLTPIPTQMEDITHYIFTQSHGFIAQSHEAFKAVASSNPAESSSAAAPNLIASSSAAPSAGAIDSTASTPVTSDSQSNVSP